MTKSISITLATLLLASASMAQKYLPPASTPGAINAKVTQANIRSTICAAGWTKTIRPGSRYTNKLKIAQMKELGLTGTPKDFEEDHFVSLEIGGNPTDPANLWPQPWPEARLKDVTETYLKRQVCSGAVTLKAAQNAIRRDWTVIYLRISGKSVQAALAAKNRK